MRLSSRRLGSLAASTVLFALVSVLAGVLVAGLFLPLTGLLDLGGRATATELTRLPAALQTSAPASRTRVLLADGETLAYFYDENRIPVSLREIAPVMRQAQIAIEDHRFYQHGALDLKGTLRALVRNSSSAGNIQGGSSISQQYVKLVQVEACQARADAGCVREATAPTLERKIRELRYAIALEGQLSKDEILLRYLNLAYYGQGAYGVEAAARHYFSTSAARLTLPEAAMLAGLVQNPDARNPVRSPAAALDRRDVVLNRMAELGLISREQLAAGKRTGFDARKVRTTHHGCVGTRYPFLCDYVRRSLLQAPSLGRTADERQALLDRGGLTIRTTIDPRSQDLAQRRVSAVVGPKDPLISTLSMVQPGTGRIIAMAQSRPTMGSDARRGETYWNLSVDPAMGGAQGYQAGSTFKAFTAAAALQRGIPLSRTLDAPKTMTYTGRSYRTCTGRGHVTKKWRVSNSTGRNGVMDMATAAEYSVNNYFVQLELETGMCNVTEMAQRLGVKLGTRDRDLVDYYQHVPAFTLGSVEVSPLSMAEAYATFAARGVHCTPVLVASITAADGRALAAPSAGCRQVIPTDVADGVNALLGHVMTDGTGRKAATTDRRPQAGKTGTISSAEAVWFAGYTPEVAAVAMISIDNQRRPFVKSAAARRAGQFRSHGVNQYRIPSSHIRLQGTGSGDAGRKIWKPTMDTYLRDVPRTAFHTPPVAITDGRFVDLPGLSGLDVQAATRLLERRHFTVDTRYVPSAEPRGTVLGWSPGSGRVRQFSTVHLDRSSGHGEPDVLNRDQQGDNTAVVQQQAAQLPPTPGG